jgi:hypothetical protein
MFYRDFCFERVYRKCETMDRSDELKCCFKTFYNPTDIMGGASALMGEVRNTY